MSSTDSATDGFTDEGVSSTEEEEEEEEEQQHTITIPFKSKSTQKGKTKILAKKSEIRVGDINVLVTGSPDPNTTPVWFQHVAMLSSGVRLPPWQNFPQPAAAPREQQPAIESSSDSDYPSDLSRKNSESSCVTDEDPRTGEDDSSSSSVRIREVDSFLHCPTSPHVQEYETREFLWTPGDFEAALSFREERSSSASFSGSDMSPTKDEDVRRRHTLPSENPRAAFPRVKVESSVQLPRVHIDPILSLWRPTNLQFVEKAGFRLGVVPGAFYELDGCHYVRMRNGASYTVTARNLTALRCHADLYVQGLLAFRLYLSAGDSVDLEGPQFSDKRFVFLRTLDAPSSAGIDSKSADNGLIKCIFTPEASTYPGQHQAMKNVLDSVMSNISPQRNKEQYRGKVCSGATALQGYQRPLKLVTDFDQIVENPDGAVTIILRLVTTTDDDGKPSTEFPIHPLRTPEPPPVPLC